MTFIKGSVRLVAIVAQFVLACFALMLCVGCDVCEAAVSWSER